jgi:hypothetical protein
MQGDADGDGDVDGGDFLTWQRNRGLENHMPSAAAAEPASANLALIAVLLLGPRRDRSTR